PSTDPRTRTAYSRSATPSGRPPCLSPSSWRPRGRCSASQPLTRAVASTVPRHSGVRHRIALGVQRATDRGVCPLRVLQRALQRIPFIVREAHQETTNRTQHRRRLGNIAELIDKRHACPLKGTPHTGAGPVSWVGGCPRPFRRTGVLRPTRWREGGRTRHGEPPPEIRSARLTILGVTCSVIHKG